jgi:serine/alanine adding enzyme
MKRTKSNATLQACTVNLLSDWRRLQPAWDEFVQRHSKGSIFHTSEMIRVFEAANGYSTVPLAALSSSGEILALLVAVRVQTLPAPFGGVSSRSLWFAEPICQESSKGIDALCELIERHDCIMSRNTLFAEVRPLDSLGCERLALESCGYTRLDYLNYIVDVTRPKEQLWNALRANSRTSIRKCERQGFTVRHDSSANSVESLCEFLTLTFQRAKVPLPDCSLFHAAAEILGPKRWIKFVAAFDAQQQVGMDAMLVFKRRVIGWYGGALRLKGASAYEFMQWNEIAWAADNGFGVYDFGGAGWPDEPYGVRDFKARFGGELVCYGRYRKVYAPRTLALAERAFELSRALISPKK